MKKFKIFIALIFMLLPLQGIFAQTDFTSKTADITHFAAIFPNTNINSLTSIYSAWFTLAGYETTEPYVLAAGSIYYPDKLFGSYKFTSASSKPRLTLIVQGSNDVSDTTQHFAVDTLSAVSDSVETWQNFSVNFNGNKYLYYRLYFKTSAGNPADVYAKVDLYKPRKKLQ